MTNQHDTQTTAEQQSIYFNLLAEIGHTKHIGGLKATGRLLELIVPRAGDKILDVGCGVGIAAVFLAENVGCRVTAVDITPRMIERARERANRAGVADLVDFRVASMEALPFEDNAFDSAMAESVLSFSEDRVQVVNELARVVKPGGVVAFTEAIWVLPPPEGKGDFMARAAGLPDGLLDNEAWQAVMEASVLQEVVAEAYAITAREESQSQFGRVPLSDYLRAVPGFFRAITNAQYRQVFSKALGSTPKEYYKHIGYGVYSGRSSENEKRETEA